MIERRQLPRWEIKKEAKVWMSQVQVFNHCLVEDIHLKGMRVSFNSPLPRQKTVRMSFMIGEHFDLIKIEAQICWMKEEGDRFIYGVSFSHISEEDKDKIYQYITAHCSDQFTNNRWAQHG